MSKSKQDDDSDSKNKVKQSFTISHLHVEFIPILWLSIWCPHKYILTCLLNTITFSLIYKERWIYSI